MGSDRVLHATSEDRAAQSMNWSLSKLGTFQKCRRKFLYAYIQRRPQKRGAAADRGVDFHKAIEDYFLSKVPLPPELIQYQPWFDQLRELEHFAENKLAMLEGWLPCAWEDPKVWWKGVLDLKVLRGEDAWVFDWKTGKVYEDHVDQKELYTIATFVEHPNVNTVEAWHVYLDYPGKHTKEIYHREQLEQLIAKWNGKLVPYQQALNLYNEENAEMFFVANPTYLCNYCSFGRGQGGPCQFG